MKFNIFAIFRKPKQISIAPNDVLDFTLEVDRDSKGHHKLNDADKAAIIAMYATGRFNQAHIAKLFKVSQPTINTVLKGCKK